MVGRQRPPEAIGGIDHTTYRLFSPNDAFGRRPFCRRHGDAHDECPRREDEIDGPSLGVYGVYVNGGFSVDVNAKVDFLALDQTSALPISSDLRSYATAANLNYKFDIGGGWIEPTVGAIYTVTRWDSAMSALDGHTVRVQGGVRFGQSFTYGAVAIEPTLLGLLYSDVVIEGGNINNLGVPLAPTDEGKLFELAALKLNFDFGSGLSTSIEGEVRHGSLDSGAEVVGSRRQGWPSLQVVIISGPAGCRRSMTFDPGGWAERSGPDHQGRRQRSAIGSPHLCRRERWFVRKLADFRHEGAKIFNA